LALVDDLTGIGLDATDLGVLLDCLGASSVLDLVACLTTIDIDTVDLVTLLEDVLALDVPKLLADVTALLTGTPHAGLITPLFNALMSPAVQQLLAEATGFGLPTHWVADLLNDLSALDLVVAELADLLLGLEGLGVDSAALAAVLRTLAGFDLLAIVPGTDLGGVLTGLSTNPATPSRFERFVVLAGAGEDRVVLGELPAGAEFTGVVRLYGGRDTDTLSASPRNQYRAGPNTEDFEAGSF
jgi:hypothetical protein